MARQSTIVVLAFLYCGAPIAAAQSPCTFEWKPGESLPGVDREVIATTTWDPDGPGPEPELLVVGGEFTIAGDVIASKIAAWNGSFWQSLGEGVDGRVNALTVYNGELIAAGSFTAAGGVSANGIARWNGTTWQSLGEGVDGWVNALTVYNGELIAGGDFTTAGGASANHIARWDGSAWQSLGDGVDDWVNALTVYNGELIGGGYFWTAGGVGTSYIARWNGSTWQSLGEGVDDWVNALTVYNGELIAGGWFSSAGDDSANGIARWNGSVWQPLGGEGFNVVFALTVYNGELIAGGYFTTAGGVSAKYIARWDGSTWQPLGAGMDNRVLALTIYNGELIAGGHLWTAGGVETRYIARWNGSVWQSLGAGLHASEVGVVNALLVCNGELIAGGEFDSTGGALVNNIARWNGSTWQPLGGGMYGSVFALTVYNGELIAGGSFLTAGGAFANSITRWNGSTWQPLGGGMNDSVYDLTVYNGELIAGGRFTMAGGASANHIARWDGTTWKPLAEGMNGPPWALTVYNGELAAGGAFTTAGGRVSAYFARWGVVSEEGSDEDEDASPDACDNCPAMVNTDQFDCDADGQGNACDSVDRIYVDAEAPAGGDGSSWATAYRHLNLAIDQANTAPCNGRTVEIWVANGTYIPDGGYTPAGGVRVPGTGNRSATFQLRSGVAIYGGFVGNETELAQRPADPDPLTADPTTDSILSGDLAGNDLPNFGNNGDNSFHLVTGSATDATAVLDGFTITAGNASADQGGGMRVESGSPTMRNCAFLTNRAADHGGAVENRGASAPTFETCVFRANLAVNEGGAIRCRDASTATFSHCSFADNSAGLYGGAIVLHDTSQAAMTDCTFLRNTATRGGAIHQVASGMSLADCTFIGNQAVNQGGAIFASASSHITRCTFAANRQFNASPVGTDGGGAIYNTVGAVPVISQCTFANNAALYGGAALFSRGASPHAVNCRFIGNTATGSFAGAIAGTDGGTTTLINCLLAGNTAVSDGGAIGGLAGAVFQLTNCSLSGNRAARFGGGVYVDDHGGLAQAIVRNSILWGNVDGSGTTSAAQIYRSGAAPATVMYSDVQGGYAGTANISTDPIFVSNPSAASGTFTGTVSASYNASTGLTIITATGGLPDAANIGRSINPKAAANQYVQSIIVNIDGAGMTIRGDHTALGITTDTPYRIYDYRLSGGSPAIDSARNDDLPIDVTDLDGDADTDEPLPLDLDGADRRKDVVAMADCPQGGCGDAPVVDMGPYEVQSSGPLAVCRNLSFSFDDATTTVTVTAAELDNGSAAGEGSITAIEIAKGTPGCSSEEFAPSVEYFCGPLPDPSVTLRVTQADGQQACCAAEVTIQDIAPPVIHSCGADITVPPDENCEVRMPDVTQDVATSDNCHPGTVPILQFPSMGTLLPPGDTVVTIQVQDLGGHVVECTKTVTAGACQDDCPADPNKTEPGTCGCGRDDAPASGDGVAPDEHRVFVSSATYTGDLGGLAGADDVCQMLAGNAGLTRPYRAILSSETVPANARIRLNGGGIYLVDPLGNKLAVKSNGNLWDGLPLEAPISLDEMGTSRTVSNVWTGSTSTGETALNSTCQSWTSAEPHVLGRVGIVLLGSWINQTHSACIQNNRRVYCISQGVPLTSDCNGNTVPDQCEGMADTDDDGIFDPCDECPSDPGKSVAGQCGCGTADTDSDADGTANCNDGCPEDPGKAAPGQCGCGVPDTDNDEDGTANCNDLCPDDPAKTAPGTCGCGRPEGSADSDGDGIADCNDNCPAVANPDQLDTNGNQVGDACDGTLVLYEPFEAYASQSAFESVWPDTANSAYLLFSGFGHPGQSLRMISPPGNGLGRYFRDLGATWNGTDALPLVFSFDLWLDPAGAAGNWSGARHFCELRGYAGGAYNSGGLQNLIAIGAYNTADVPGELYSNLSFQARVLGTCTTPCTGWYNLGSTGVQGGRSAGWHRFRIQIRTSDIRFWVDGVPLRTVPRPNTNGFNAVVLGSDLTAEGHTVHVDNVVVLNGNAAPDCNFNDVEDTLEQDPDSDGHICDNCPAMANADQADADGDQVGDACDNCPGTVLGATVGADGCPAAIRFDFDDDGDVDGHDLEAFENCASGPAIPVPVGCEASDADGDGDADQSDFGVFQRCYSGENTPAEPGCAE